MFSSALKVHHEHPRSALCPKNCDTFRRASISADTHGNAAFTIWPFGLIGIPFHKSNRSSIIGFRNLVIFPLGSVGPGITPTTIAHSLHLTSLGKFNTVIIIAETLYSDCLNGLNQLIFNQRPMLLLSLRKGTEG